MPNKRLYLVVVLGLFFLGLILLIQGSQACAKLECLSMQSLDKFQVKEVYQDDTGLYRALLSQDDDLLRVEVRSDIPRDDAERHIKGQIIRMKALFEKATSPYPGEISDAIECAEEFKPVLGVDDINGIEVSHFTGYLNQRLVFGVCTEDQAFYRGIMALFYCPAQEQLFQLEIIAPKSNFLEEEDKYLQKLYSIDCQ